MPEKAEYAPLLQFWFGELTDGLAAPHIQQRWFQADAQFDQQCGQFSPLLDRAAAGELMDWRANSHGCLAYILLCDQFPRNIFRGTARAFAWDHLAVDAATRGITANIDQTLGWDERSFFYMPFEHSEQILHQHTAVGLFTGLRDESPPQLRARTGNSMRFAQQHRDIIKRFGRFPHRNAVLGRTSTAEELAFIAGGDGFGQSTSEQSG